MKYAKALVVVAVVVGAMVPVSSAYAQRPAPPIAQAPGDGITLQGAEDTGKYKAVTLHGVVVVSPQARSKPTGLCTINFYVQDHVVGSCHSKCGSLCQTKPINSFRASTR